MAHYTGTAPQTSVGADILRVALAPFRAVLNGMSTIVAANRLAHEFSELSQASDEKLASLGIKRTDIATYVARHSENMRLL